MGVQSGDTWGQGSWLVSWALSLLSEHLLSACCHHASLAHPAGLGGVGRAALGGVQGGVLGLPLWFGALGALLQGEGEGLQCGLLL